jgi:hypothetical protein
MPVIEKNLQLICSDDIGFGMVGSKVDVLRTAERRDGSSFLERLGVLDKEWLMIAAPLIVCRLLHYHSRFAYIYRQAVI